jgi:UDP-glucose 4-epimerase
LMKNILITGAFGYVGGRVSKFLAETQKYQLFLTSRKNRALPNWATNSHLVSYSLENNHNIIKSLPQIDTIVHFASINELICAKSPELAVELNTMASFRFIQNAIGASVKRFIYFSTAHVYGAPLKGVFNEDCLTRPTHPYAYTHRAVEDYVAAAHDQGQMDGISVRLTNSIGAPIEKEVDRWMLLVSDLCKQVIIEGRLVLKSFGSQKRGFIGLGDVCRGVDHLISMKDCLGNGIFNLGGDFTVSIYDMACLISKRASLLFGKEFPVIRPQGVDEEWELDYSSKKLAATGFTPEGCIEKEIDELLLFCRHNFNKDKV